MSGPFGTRANDLPPLNIPASPGKPSTAFETIAAGAESEAILTDYWFQSGRREGDYYKQAAAKAKELGYEPEEIRLTGLELPEAHDESFSRDYSAIERAVAANPDAFGDMPVTAEAIRNQVTNDLQGELEDAQAVYDLRDPGFFSRGVPDFLGRVGTGMTDPVNVGITAGTLGLGATANLGRMVLVEGALGVLGEAGTLPQQFTMAERLNVEDPNVALQLTIGGVAGAGLPMAFRGAGRAAGFTSEKFVQIKDSELVKRMRNRASELTATERAAVNKIEAEVAEKSIGPAQDGRDQVQATDAAAQAINNGDQVSTAAPQTSAANVENLTTSPKEKTRGEGESAALSLEASLGALLRDKEARGSYSTQSDFTVIPAPRDPTDMTVDEILAWQVANRNAGAASTAVGGYQIIYNTLRGLKGEMGLTGKEKFDAKLQDRMGIQLMERRGLTAFKRGEISREEFADNLAQEWAALPLGNGRSAYAGDGLNASQVGRGTVLSILDGEGYSSAIRTAPTPTRVFAGNIQADPKAYQFRSDIDARGVENPLSRVKQWDEILAGDFILHERMDGQVFVADGHHRLDLAQRLMNEGSGNIEFNSFVLREAEGYSVEMVRAIAAIKNIENGNAKAVDAAKVLRVDPAMLERMSLRSTMARDARGLMKLSDDSFDMVTNELVPEPYAAFVGDLTDDFDLQDAIMRVLITSKPKTALEARQIAQDAHRLGLEAREADAQDSLFGDDFNVADTLLKERADVLRRSLAKIRADRRVFATLVEEQERIAKAGNVLTESENLARLDTNEMALLLIEKLVNRAGPLDDALTEAARKARRGGISRGVNEFTEAIRSTIERGDADRLIAGRDGSDGDVAAPNDRTDEGSGETSGQARQADEGIATQSLEGDAALGDMFDDPSFDNPDIVRQADAAENDIRSALEDGEDFEIPIGRETGDGDDRVAETISVREALDELEQDQHFVEAINVCKS